MDKQFVEVEPLLNGVGYPIMRIEGDALIIRMQGKLEGDAAMRAATAMHQWLGRAIGSGYKLVPVEPTIEMDNAGIKAFQAPENRHGDVLGEVYRAMLAAAPTTEGAPHG